MGIDPERRKPHSTRTTYFKGILELTDNHDRSIRYEDTPYTTIYSHDVKMAYSNKRFKLFRSRADYIDASSETPKVPLLIRFYDPKVNAEDAIGRTLDQILAWDDDELEMCHDYIQMLFPLPEGSMFSMHSPVIDREVMEAFHERAELRSRLRESFVRMLAFYGFQMEVHESSKEEEAEEEAGHCAPATEQEGGALETDHCEGRTNINVEVPDASTPAQQHTSQDEKGPAPTPGPIIPETTPPQSKGQPASLLEPATSVNPPQEHGYSLPPVLKVIRAPNCNRAFRNWALRFDHNHLRMTRIIRSLRVLGLREECAAFYAALRDVFNEPRIFINERSMRFWRKALRNPLHIAPDGEQVPWLRQWVEEQEQAEPVADDVEQLEETKAKQKRCAES